MSRKRITLIFGLAMLPLMGWWSYGLFDLDEGFYAAVTAEMNRRHEWITPFYNGTPWYEKPILLYWLAKPSVMLFGGEFGLRLPSIIAAFLGFWAVWHFARRRMSGAAAEASVLVLATSLLWVALSRLMMTDTLLVVSFCVACLWFYESLVGDWRWRIGTAALLGVGVLAKGPVAILLFVPILGWTLLREPGLRPQSRRGWAIGTAALSAVVATWYLPAYLKDGQLFVQKFLVEQNLQRFTGGDAAHTIGGIANLFFFLPVMLVGMAPWVWWLAAAWPRRASDSLDRYLATCAAVPFLFFTVSGAKLVHYVLPCCIPIALLVGRWMARRWTESEAELPTSRLRMLGAGSVFLCVLANAGFGYWYRASGHAEVHALARYCAQSGFKYVAAYQMPRREKSLGTGRPKLQETSHPSLEFYTDSVVLQAETLGDLERAEFPLYVLTRSERFSAADFATLKHDGFRMTPLRSETWVNYELYRLDRPAPSRTKRTPSP